MAAINNSKPAADQTRATREQADGAAGKLVKGLNVFEPSNQASWARGSAGSDAPSSIVADDGAITVGRRPVFSPAPKPCLRVHDVAGLIEERSALRSADGPEAESGGYVYAAAGNVLAGDSVAGEDGEALRLQNPSVSEWAFINPYSFEHVAIAFADGAHTVAIGDSVPSPPLAGGFCSYRFDGVSGVSGAVTFGVDGSYALEMRSENALHIADFTVGYTLKDGDMTGTANLSLSTGDYEPHSEGGVVIHGDDGSYIISGTDHSDLIYGGGGDDSIYGGGGGDVFVWENAKMIGGTDTIKNFHFGEDRLSFDDLFDTNPSMEELIARFADGTLALRAEDGDLFLDVRVLDEDMAERTQHIQLHVVENPDYIMDADAINKGDCRAAADLLKQLLLTGTNG